MNRRLGRRKFMRPAAAAAACTIIPWHVREGGGRIPPSDRMTLAHIGMGTQGFSELGFLLDDPGI